jgi:5-formyltetrahydrofolate cyclo-ligase
MSAHIIDVIGDLPPGDIAVYVSMPGEPPTGQLRSELTARGFRPLIPRVSGSNLQWAADTGATEWDTNMYGTQEPINEFIGDQVNALAKCVAVVLPAHAVDPQGMRLGQGKGFYDRALEFTRTKDSKPLLISLTFDSEYLPEVPHEPHDIPVDVSVTESTVRWFHTPD